MLRFKAVAYITNIFLSCVLWKSTPKASKLPHFPFPLQRSRQCSVCLLGIAVLEWGPVTVTIGI